MTKNVPGFGWVQEMMRRASERDQPREQERREELGLAGRRLGLTFTPTIPPGLLRDVPVPPPMLNSDHTWKSGFAWGTWQGVDVKVFEWNAEAMFGYSVDSIGMGRWHCLCALTEADASFPRLSITPRSPGSRLISFIPPVWQRNPITLPWNTAFDRAFEVRPDDPARAAEILGEDLMNWLRTIRRRGVGFAMKGPFLICYWPKLRPEHLEHLLDALMEFRRRVFERRSS